MIPTNDLISALAANLSPVQRLRPPVLRATGFLLLAALIVVMIAAAHGWRADLFEQLAAVQFSLGLAGSIFTGILAALAAFIVSLPGRSPRWLLLPLPALALWLSSISYQCLSRWVALVPGNAPPGETAACIATLVLTSIPLALALGFMLRYAARLNPTPVILAGSLAVAGITSTALMLIHPLDASMEILVFNIGTALLVIGGGGILNLLVAKRGQWAA